MNDPVREVEQQIELTRQALDHTLRELQVQLSPRYQVRRAWRATQALSMRTARQSSHWVRAHPLPLLAITVTLVGLLYLAVRRRRA
jgi:uncharacterized membrane protein YdfJ with MMPL/SSD domain